MSAGSLQIGTWHNGSPGFINQGQVDWVAFGNTIWQASSAVLQRFASAGVQPVTLGATLAIANNFHLSQLGRQRVEQSLSSLRLEYGFEKLLFFGFGYRSFLRILGETQLGINTIALCGCLSQTHVVELSASVLGEMWQELGYPEQYRPSHNQFLLLAESCAGSLASSTFDDTVNLMLGPKFRHSNEIDSDDEDGRSLDTNDARRPHVRAASAHEIARVLLKLFKLSTAEMDQISVVGGVECAFVAAFAHWALGLRIQVKDDDGELIFTSVLDESKAQVIFRYQNDTASPSMELTGVVYYLNDPADIFVHTQGPGLELIIRTPWSQCFRRTFGPSFDDLIKPFHLLSSYLGSGARIYKAIATGEVYEGELKDCLSRKGFNTFVETSYGQGLVYTIVNTFPELDMPNFREKMQRAANVSITDAIKAANLASQSLSQLCRCNVCRHDGPDASLFCLRQLANTIFQLAVQLGCAVWDPSLRPAVAGLLAFYYGVSSQIMSKDIGNQEVISFGAILANGHIAVSDPLNDISAIFDGQTSPFTEPDMPHTTAFSRNGICYFIEALQHLSSKAEMLRRIHVLPGHIQHGDRRHDMIRDGESWFSSIPDAETEPWGSTEIPKPLVTSEMDVKAMISERGKAQTLLFYYKVSADNFTAMLQPGRMTQKVLARTGIITCHKGAQCPQILPGPCLSVQSGWRPKPKTAPPKRKLPPTRSRPGSPTDAMPTFYIWAFGSDVARLVALETHARQQLVYDERHDAREWEDLYCFLRRDECLACSMAAGYYAGSGTNIHIL